MVFLKIDDKKNIGYEINKNNLKPIDYVLIGVTMCLGHEIVESSEENKFGEVCVYFGNNKLKISCVCEDNDRVRFKEIISNCYIVQNLKFEKEVSFKSFEKLDETH
jgi:hypothetical protein